MFFGNQAQEALLVTGGVELAPEGLLLVCWGALCRLVIRLPLLLVLSLGGGLALA